MSAPLSLTIGDDGIAVVRLAAPRGAVPTLDASLLPPLRRALDEVGRRAGLLGLLVASDHPDVFCAGADLKGLRARMDAPDVDTWLAGLAAEGQAALAALERLAIPTVAVVAGAALGGGAELAIACRWRVAADRPEVRLGFPEVRLGLIPGLGGTQRLPRLIGLPAALDLLVTGRELDARRARRAGLVDAVVPAEDAIGSARRLLARAVAGERPRRRLPWLARLATDVAPVRAWVLRRALRTALARTHGRYPAVPAVLATVRAGFATPGPAGYAAEARVIGACASTPVARHLVDLFLRSRETPAIARGEGPPIARVGVLGAGLMGAGLAHWCAARGCTVVAREVDAAAAGRGLATVARLAAEEARSGRRTAADAAALVRRVDVRTDFAGFARCEFVIEAVVEDLAAKREVLAAAEAACGPGGAILATNTSTLAVRDIAVGLRDPARFVGLHFFHPVRRMALVEVVRGPATGEAAVAAAVRFARQLGKTPIVVADQPGFLVNRLLGPYLAEAAACVEEGADVARLDAALEAFGMPMGPFRLLHEVGLGTARRAAAVMRAAFGRRWAATTLLDHLDPAVPLFRGPAKQPRLDRRVLAAGLDAARRGRSTPPRSGIPDGELVARCVWTIVNEAAHALADAVVPSAADLDLAMVLGAGFAPWTGGPCRHADATGLAAVVRELEGLAAAHGPRFTPAPRLRELADARQTFHGPASA